MLFHSHERAANDLRNAEEQQAAYCVPPMGSHERQPMTAIPLLRINPDADLRRERISAGEFCIVVDGFLEDPDMVVEVASRHRSDFSHPNVGYPGVQIRVHDGAMAEIFRFVRSKMSKEFGFMRGRIGIRSLLSLVTLPPERLSFMQRICHVDPNPDTGRAKYAALIYLFRDERLGGTGFYRWRDEELVWKGVGMLRKDAAEGEEFMKRHFETFRQPPRYMTESNDVAELLYTVAPRFNRFVFYSGDLPHTGAVLAPELLSEDPRNGRLTLNLFFSALPKEDAFGGDGPSGP
jgi:hypothetical protein